MVLGIVLIGADKMDVETAAAIQTGDKSLCFIVAEIVQILYHLIQRLLVRDEDIGAFIGFDKNLLDLAPLQMEIAFSLWGKGKPQDRPGHQGGQEGEEKRQEGFLPAFYHRGYLLSLRTRWGLLFLRLAKVPGTVHGYPAFLVFYLLFYYIF